MGSLLPGWDERAPGIAPKEFQDYNENEEENQGYFAAYAKLKKLQKEAGEPSSPIAIGQRSASLARRSAEPRLSSSTSLRRNSLSRASAPMSPQGTRSLSRAETMAAGGHRAGNVSGAPPPKPLQRMFSMPMTRGERGDVLGGLAVPSPSAFSSSVPRSPGSLDAYKTQQPDKEKADIQWWRNMDSAAMNERPDEPVDKEKGYTPQFAVTGQTLHYIADADTHGPSVIPAH